MIFLRVSTVLLLLASPLVFADALDIALNNNSAAFSYSTSAGGTAELHAGLLYNDATNSLVEAGMLAKGEDSDSGITITPGAKVLGGLIRNYQQGPTKSVGAILIGGELGVAFPDAKQLSAGISFFVGPKITAFGDANRANQWGAHLDYEVSPGTKVYLEYREADFGIIKSTQTATLDSGTYMGVKLAF